MRRLIVFLSIWVLTSDAWLGGDDVDDWYGDDDKELVEIAPFECVGDGLAHCRNLTRHETSGVRCPVGCVSIWDLQDCIGDYILNNCSYTGRRLHSTDDGGDCHDDDGINWDDAYGDDGCGDQVTPSNCIGKCLDKCKQSIEHNAKTCDTDCTRSEERVYGCGETLSSPKLRVGESQPLTLHPRVVFGTVRSAVGSVYSTTALGMLAQSSRCSLEN